MRITSIETHVVDFYRTNLIFIEIRSDEGIVGVGEATLEGRERAVLGAIDDLREPLVGRDPRRIAHTMYELTRDGYWRGGPVVSTALSAIDIALWDLNARLLNVPIHQLIGGQTRDRVKAYANGWFSGSRSAAEYAEAAVRTVKVGFRGLKWDPFENYDLTITSAQLDRALEQIGAVRDAVGDDVEIFIEGHGRFDVSTAIAIGRELEQFRPVWFEEPTPPDNIDALVEVRQRSRVPIAAGERWFGRQGALLPLSRRAVDYIQPDVTHAGGFSELTFISTLAASSYIGFAPHNPSGPVSTAASLQLGAALPNFRYLEIMATDVPWRPLISSERLTLTPEGDVLIPTGPGLGIELRTDVFEEYPFAPHPLRLFEDAVYDIRPRDERSFFNLDVQS